MRTFIQARANERNGTTDATKLIAAPKGIYKTPHGYRVQLNIERMSRSKNKVTVNPPNSKGKFSRNSKTFEQVILYYCYNYEI